MAEPKKADEADDILNALTKDSTDSSDTRTKMGSTVVQPKATTVTKGAQVPTNPPVAQTPTPTTTPAPKEPRIAPTNEIEEMSDLAKIAESKGAAKTTPPAAQTPIPTIPPAQTQTTTPAPAPTPKKAITTNGTGPLTPWRVVGNTLQVAYDIKGTNTYIFEKGGVLHYTNDKGQDVAWADAPSMAKKVYALAKGIYDKKETDRAVEAQKASGLEKRVQELDEKKKKARSFATQAAEKYSQSEKEKLALEEKYGKARERITSLKDKYSNANERASGLEEKVDGLEKQIAEFERSAGYRFGDVTLVDHSKSNGQVYATVKAGKQTYTYLVGSAIDAFFDKKGEPLEVNEKYVAGMELAYKQAVELSNKGSKVRKVRALKATDAEE